MLYLLCSTCLRPLQHLAIVIEPSACNECLIIKKCVAQNPLFDDFGFSQLCFLAKRSFNTIIFVFLTMAPKSAPWVTETAQRLEVASADARFRLERSNAAHAGALAKAAPWRRSNETLTPAQEIAAVRFVQPKALSFQPARHQIVVEGRPVVVLAAPSLIVT